MERVPLVFKEEVGVVDDQRGVVSTIVYLSVV
jgi:hypothetical protein